jgi:hypothetical protein
MDISAEKHGTSGNPRADSFSAFRQTVRSIVRRLVEFFTITESDRKQAGIFLRRRGS